MHQDAKDILYTEEQLKARVAELGHQISADYKGESVVLVGVLKGAIVFFTDLARSIDENVDVSFDFISCSSYGSGTTSTGVVRILKDLDRSVEGKHVLVVEDIVDTGTTLHYLLENLHARGAKSVRLAALLNKPERRKMDVEVDYVGFVIPDYFVIGYGLDYAEKYRHHRGGIGMSVHKHGTTGPGCAGTCCLKATDLGVSFGGEEVLRDVSFHLHCGEIVALIGPNGAGKSSLFRTILGQVPHTGTIEFQRAGGDKTRPLIGYVPQSPSFDRGDPVSVFDFFSAAISRYPVFLPSPRSLRARVGACLARVHGESLLDRRMGALSGGELQRVLLALALEPLPHILVLDEPLSGVDIDGEKQLLDMLDEIRTRYDLSILLSTHDFATLGQFADKVILLKGTVLRVGPPDEVLASPEFQEVFHLNLGKGNLGKGGRG